MKNSVIALLLLVATPAAADPVNGILGAPYAAFRENLLRTGFMPSQDPSVCAPSDDRCHRFPEMRFCDPTPPYLCTASWKSARGTPLRISTIGRKDPVVYILSEGW